MVEALMAKVGMIYIGTAYKSMACIVMAYRTMAPYRRNLCSDGLSAYGFVIMAFTFMAYVLMAYVLQSM